MNIIILAVIIWALIRFRKQIITKIKVSLGSHTTQRSGFDYTLSAILTTLTAEERVTFRNGWDSFYLSVRDKRDQLSMLQLSELYSLYSAGSKHPVTEDELKVIYKVLTTASEAARTAPAMYRSLVSIDEVFIFYKETI